MARSINKVILVGNLGKDAETQFTQSGTAVTRFSVATSRRWKDQQTDEWKEETNWTNVVLWKQEGLGWDSTSPKANRSTSKEDCKRAVTKTKTAARCTRPKWLPMTFSCSVASRKQHHTRTETEHCGKLRTAV